MMFALHTHPEIFYIYQITIYRDIVLCKFITFI